MSATELEQAEDTPQTGGPEVAICVGQRSCALCSRLGELLNENPGNDLRK